MVFSSLLLNFEIFHPLSTISRVSSCTCCRRKCCWNNARLWKTGAMPVVAGLGLEKSRPLHGNLLFFFFSIFWRGEEEKKKKNPNSASWNVESAQRRLVKRVDARRKTSFDIQHGWLICPCWLYAMALTPNGSVRVLARHARPLLIGVHSDYTQAQYT